MSGCVVWKCTICGNENAAWNCPCAICGHARKPVTNETPPTEMTSLREIKDKLDELKRRLECIVEPVLASFENRLIEAHNLSCVKTAKLDALAESQGKLLAALNDIGGNISTNDSLIMGHLQAIDNRLDALDAGLHETAMRNHAQLLDGQKAISQRLDAKDNTKFLSNMESMKPVPRKARKKARSAVGKAR